MIGYSIAHDLATDTWRAVVEVDHPSFSAPFQTTLTASTRPQLVDALTLALGEDECRL